MGETRKTAGEHRQIELGHVLAYRVFDAGEEIAIDVVERRIPDARRVELKGPQVEGLVITVRPPRRRRARAR